MKPLDSDDFLYFENFISTEEEIELLQHVHDLPFSHVRMFGVKSRRSVCHFGFKYLYDNQDLGGADDFPIWLQMVAKRCEQYAGLPDGFMNQALVSKYPPGAGIGWHTDAPVFGHTVAGVSLGFEARLRLRNKKAVPEEAVRRSIAFDLEPRSLYIIRGALRSSWQHCLSPVRQLRVALTFRSVSEENRAGFAKAGEVERAR